MDCFRACAGKPDGAADNELEVAVSGTVPVVLVANRAEIACRIIKACHKLHLRAVAVYTEAGACQLTSCEHVCLQQHRYRPLIAVSDVRSK